MGLLRWLRVSVVVVTCLLLQTEGADKYTDENRPYEFGFSIDGQQHRHEKKDKNGIIMGEFGFITADDVYHVTVYATDENGRFKIISMKNIHLKSQSGGSTRQGHSLQIPSSPNTISASPTLKSPSNPEELKPISIEPPANSCSHCSIPTTSTIAPPPILPGINNPNSATAFSGISGPSPTSQNKQSFESSQQSFPNQPSSVPSVNSQGPSNIIGGQTYQPNSALGVVPPLGSNGQNFPQQGSFNQAGIAGPNTFNQQNTQLPSIQSSPQKGSNEYLQPQSQPQQPGQQSNINSPQSYTPGNTQGGSSSQVLENQGPQNPYPNQNIANQDQTPEYFNVGAPGPRTPKLYSGRPDESANALQPGQRHNTQNDGINTNGRAPSTPGTQSPNEKPTLAYAQMQLVDKNTDVYAKRPGEKEGLPQGLTEKDMVHLLYTFNYTLGFQAHFEEGYSNGAKQGYYYVTGRNGVRTRIDYVADDKGFRPKISQEVLDLLSDDVPKPETEKEEKYGLKGYEFKWLYYPVESKA